MTTSFAQLDLKSISLHPHNPRHSAKADEEMVASIVEHGLIQPLIVAPYDDGYVLIAGHRRLDGLKKARCKDAPCVIRADLDTDAKQVEQMVIENVHRSDLTAIEEAEAYEQLRLFGYTQKRIASATGRSAKTVQGRLKLLKLAKPTREKVHTGQLSIDDAIAITEFVDDPKIVKALEQAVGTYNFRYAIETARRNRKAEREAAAVIEDLRGRGIPETKVKKVAAAWMAFENVAGVVDLGDTPLRKPDEHEGCLTFAVVPATQYSATQVVYGCTHETGHDGEMSDDERRIRLENAEAEAERKALHEARAAAQAVRIQTVILQSCDKSLPEWLRTVVRSTIGEAVYKLDHEALNIYQDAMLLEASDRWPSYARKNKKLARHLEDLDGCPDARLCRALLAVLLAHSEANFSSTYSRNDGNARRHLELLEALDHPFCDVDKELAGVIDKGDSVEAGE